MLTTLRKLKKALRALITGRVTIVCDMVSYEFHRVPIKKTINWILLEISIHLKRERPWGYPTHLLVEPTNACNLSCALCPVTEGMNRPVGHMDFSLFKSFIDELADYVFLILLWDWGEPFLNPRIYDMIALAKRLGIKVVSSTNGHIFAQGDHAERLVRSGLDSIIFAVDGMTQSTYEKYRRCGDLNRVMRGIQRVVEAKRFLNSDTPLINFRFIVMHHNEHEIPELRKRIQSLGVDLLTLKTLNPYSNDTYCQSRSSEDHHINEFMPENPVYRRFKYQQDGETRIRLEKNPCKNLWNNPAVHWNGAVCPCTYDYDERYVFGDLKKNSFKEIWFGGAYERMRHRFITSWQEMGLCGECSYAYEGGSCIDQTIAEAHFF